MKRFVDNITSLVLVLYPVLNIYLFLPGVNWGTMLLILVLPFCYFYNKHEIVKNIDVKWILFVFVLFLLNSLTHSFLKFTDDDLYWHNSMAMFLFFFLFIIYSSINISEKFIKIAVNIGLIATLAVFIQSIVIFSGGLPPLFTIPFLEIERSVSTFSLSRPSSIFSEPAHYAIYILPLLYYSIYKKKYFLMIIYLLGLILSGSSSGILIAPIIIIFELLRGRNILHKVVSILILSIIFLILYSTNYFDSLLLSISDKFIDKDNVRLFGTLPVIKLMNNFEIIFGLGFNQLATFLRNNGLFYIAYNYAPAFLFIFYSFGIIGAILFYYIVGRLYNVTHKKGYWIILILVLASDQVLFNHNLFYLLLFIYATKKISTNNIEPYSK